jgi:IS30 family transposase
MYRTLIPKKTKIRDLTEQEIQDIEDWHNDYPRKQFGYKTAREIYNLHVQKFSTKFDKFEKRMRTF